MKFTLKQSKGFSLIELMTVVAVVGIIVAIAYPAYNGFIKQAREEEGQKNLNSLIIAQTNFFSENGTYFMGSNTLALTAASGGLWQPDEVETGATQNFMYVVIPGSTGVIGTSYKATATGATANVPVTVVLTEGN